MARSIAENVLLGLAAGVAACLFLVALEAAGAAVHSFVGGPPVPRPGGEPEIFPTASRPLRLPLLVLAPAVGGLVSGLLVCRYAPEAEGDGTDAMIRAFHRRGGEIRGRVPFVKAAAAVALLASGGSGGREGPITQIGAAIGSALARFLRLAPRRRRILLLAGAAGGLGAIFRAPLGGALAAIEALYREDFETEALIPSVISSVTAYAVFTYVFGHGAIFHVPTPPVFRDPRELPFYVLLGLAAALLGIFYIRVFHRTRRFFLRLALPPAVKPALGGLAVGLLALRVPEVLGPGWGYVQEALYGRLAASALLLIAFAKIFATSFSLGSGGSAGLFGPSLFIGGMLGGAVGGFFHDFFPEIVGDPSAYVLVGMSAFFAGIAKAPIGALVMTTEISASYGLVAPLMLTSVIAIIFTRNFGIYENQVRSKFESPAHREDLVQDPLRLIRVRDLIDRLAPAPAPVPPGATIDEIHRAFEASDEDYLLVAGKEGAPRAIIESGAFLAAIEAGSTEGILAADIAVPVPIVRPRDALRKVLGEMLRHHVNHAVVAPLDEKDRRRWVITSEEIEAAHVWYLDVEE